MGLAKKKSDKTIEKRYLEKEEETGEETAYRLGKLSEWVAQIQEISHIFYWLNHKTSAVIKKKTPPTLNSSWKFIWLLLFFCKVKYDNIVSSFSKNGYLGLGNTN